MARTVLMLSCALLLGITTVGAQQTYEYPLVLRADAPMYPPLARMARLLAR